MDVKETIIKRRAYRSLDPFDVTEELISDLAESAQLAPSCGNKQPWRFVFIKEKKHLKKIFGTLSEGNKWVEKASLIIGVVSTPEFDCIIGPREYYLFDTGMATAFILLRATELGLVAHPIAGFDEEKVKEILEIPEELRLITLINIGKRSTTINPVLSENMQKGEKQRPPRKPIEEFIYRERFS